MVNRVNINFPAPNAEAFQIGPKIDILVFLETAGITLHRFQCLKNITSTNSTA
jgi:hypothetical protein